MKKALCLLLAICLTFIVTACKTENIAEQTSGELIGKTVYFGIFEQDNNLTSNQEPIAWTIMCEKNDQYLLYSNSVLYALKYSDNQTDEWNDTIISAWLNNEFINTAFSESEKAALVKETLDSEYLGNKKQYTNENLVFTLSTHELNYFSTAIKNSSFYFCVASYYAQNINDTYIYNNVDTTEYNGMADFWVRSNTVFPTINGPRGGFEIQEYSGQVYGIRPAIWVKKHAVKI